MLKRQSESLLQARCLTETLFSVLLVAVISWQYMLNRSLIDVGRPYEAWDEVVGFNATLDMPKDVRRSMYTYGSLDLAKFSLGHWLFLHSGDPALAIPQRAYSNNVPQSLVDASVSPRFGYARGIPDRRALFITREINLACTYILIAFSGLFAIWAFGARAAVVPLPFIVFSAGSAFFGSQAPFALPNAQNCVLGAIFVLLCYVAMHRRTLGALACAAVILALGVNLKIDFLLFGPSLAIAAVGWTIAPWPGSRLSIGHAAILASVFCATLAVTNPELVLHPQSELNKHLRGLQLVGSEAPSLSTNITVLHEFLDMMLREFLPGFSAAKVLVFSAFGVIGISSLAVILLGMRPSPVRKLAFVVCIGTALALLVLVPVMRANPLQPRYFLPAAAVYFMTLGLAIFQLVTAQSSWLRGIGYGVLLVAVVVYVSRLSVLTADAARLAQSKGVIDGLDSSYSRNRAAMQVVGLVDSGNFARWILVDQHAYIDLRFFREHGIRVRWINMLDYDAALKEAASDALPVLGIAAPGEPKASADWEGKYSDEQKAMYAEYATRIQGFPVLHRYGTRPMLLLDWQPVLPDDIVVVFTVGPRS